MLAHNDERHPSLPPQFVVVLPDAGPASSSSLLPAMAKATNTAAATPPTTHPFLPVTYDTLTAGGAPVAGQTVLVAATPQNPASPTAAQYAAAAMAEMAAAGLRHTVQPHHQAHGMHGMLPVPLPMPVFAPPPAIFRNAFDAAEWWLAQVHDNAFTARFLAADLQHHQKVYSAMSPLLDGSGARAGLYGRLEKKLDSSHIAFITALAKAARAGASSFDPTLLELIADGKHSRSKSSKKRAFTDTDSEEDASSSSYDIGHGPVDYTISAVSVSKKYNAVFIGKRSELVLRVRYPKNATASDTCLIAGFLGQVEDMRVFDPKNIFISDWFNRIPASS